ncbi:unnamed protein product [Microthlaspi erraticum]|uniref:PHD-type domain-containing protein n=1 Tax=Microthlaspi erraticum TaxID=1685480 RepID=A0A6D2K2Y7_9BRAS|nr:unnamed protein product [Microthlaspi erraticum]
MVSSSGSSVSVEAIVPEAEEDAYVIVCDTCGDLGEDEELAICTTCNVGAEHTYCMKLKREEVPEEWDCYLCTEKNNGVREGKEIEEAGSRKRKTVHFVDYFAKERAESSKRTSSQGQPRSFKAPRLYDNVELDLNVDPNPVQNRNPNMELGFDLNRVPNMELGFDLNRVPNMERGFDLNRVPNLDLNMEPGFDLNHVHNLDLNMEPRFDLNLHPNLDLNMEPVLHMNQHPNLDLNMEPTLVLDPMIDLNGDPTFDMNVDTNIDVHLVALTNEGVHIHMLLVNFKLDNE